MWGIAFLSIESKQTIYRYIISLSIFFPRNVLNPDMTIAIPLLLLCFRKKNLRFRVCKYEIIHKKQKYEHNSKR